MAWFSAFVHGGVLTPTRPVEFDLVEQWLSGEHVVPRARVALAAIENDDWELLAQTFGVTAQAIQHFWDDWLLDDERVVRDEEIDTFFAGFADALRKVIEHEKPLALVGEIGDTMSVTSDVNDDYVVVLVRSPSPKIAGRGSPGGEAGAHAEGAPRSGKAPARAGFPPGAIADTTD